jgi:hypothetical protein
MKRRIDLIDQHLEGRTFNDEKVRVAETALCPKSAATRDSSRLLAIALVALAAAACAQPRPYHTLTSEPVPRVGELVLPVAIDIDGSNVRWRCTYDVADTGQEFTVEQSAPFCDYHRVIP